MLIDRIIRGLYVGYAGTAVMDTSQTTIIPAVSAWLDRYFGRQQQSGQQDEASGGSDSQESFSQESSPTKVARRGAGLLGIELSSEEAEKWGNRVHWAYGTVWGTIYYLLLARPGLRSGLLYGTGLWMGSDELLLWGLGIAKAPSSYPPKSHLQALAAHLVFGATVGLSAKGMRD